MRIVKDGLRPAILGGLLDFVATVLRHVPEVRLDCFPRMADHARVLAALYHPVILTLKATNDPLKEYGAFATPGGTR